MKPGNKQKMRLIRSSNLWRKNQTRLTKKNEIHTHNEIIIVLTDVSHFGVLFT